MFRNLSSAGANVRRKLRKTNGLAKYVTETLRLFFDDENLNTSEETAINIFCLLRNLSFRVRQESGNIVKIFCGINR